MNLCNCLRIILLLCLILAGTVVSTMGAEVPAEIKMQNEKEKRLWEYRDTDGILSIKLENLKIINQDRARFGAPPVKLDILAGRVANRHCREMAENGYMSHWNLKGEKPYHRYAFIGGTDHVSENLSSITSTASLSQAPESLLKGMNESESQFMAEPPGSDGHKLNVIKKSHTDVGIGLHVYDGEFRYAQEFLDRYTTFSRVNPVVPHEGKVTLSGAAIPPDTGIYAVIAYRERITPMTVEQLNNTHSYEDYTADQAFAIWPWDLTFNEQSRTFDVTLDFNGKAPGYYYIHMYFKKPVSSIRYGLPSSADTSQAACATGIVLIHDAAVPPDVAALSLTPSPEATLIPNANVPTANATPLPPSPQATSAGPVPTVSTSTDIGAFFSPSPSAISPSIEPGTGESETSKSLLSKVTAFVKQHSVILIIIISAVIILAVILTAVMAFKKKAPRKTSGEEEQHFDY